MREIKFRAWDGKEMSYSVTIANGRFIEVEDDGETLWYWHDPSEQVAIMQYTGLKDKNGKEIYEGDIVKCYDHPTGVDNATGQVYFKDGCYMVQYGIGPLGDYGTAWTEVIGNIYENPDLLSPPN